MTVLRYAVMTKEPFEFDYPEEFRKEIGMESNAVVTYMETNQFRQNINVEEADETLMPMGLG